MREDEAATVHTITSYRTAMTHLIEQYRGRVVDSPGDNILAEFTSVVDAVNCGVEIQRDLAERNAELPENRRMLFRIGINLGDVLEEGKRIYGDGVNIAARMESLAEAGEICISGTVYDGIENKIGLEYEYLGEHEVKNIDKPVRAYRVLSFPGAAAHRVVKARTALKRKWRNTALVIVAVLVIGAVLAIWNFNFRPPPIEPASVEKMAFPLPKKPSIAVLPFDNLSGDPEQEYIADSISENIITTLSKFPHQLFVIARNSSFFYKGKSVKISQVSQELGIRYVLEGSAHKSGDRLRVSGQLIDALKGNHIWANKYDKDLTELFTVIDEITFEIAKALAIEFRLLSRKDDQINLEALSLSWKAIHHLYQLSKEGSKKAIELYEQAIKLEPTWADLWAGLANCHFQAGRYGWSESRSKSIELAEELALKSLKMDDNVGGHTVLGNIYLLRRRYDDTITEFQKAVELNPSYDHSYFLLGRVFNFNGQPDKAISFVKKGIRLHPHYGWTFLAILVKAYYHSGRYEDALAACEQMLDLSKEGQVSPKWPHLLLSMVLIELGRDQEARAHMKKVLEYDPYFNIEDRRKQNLYKDPAQNERELAAHRKAGAPEHPPPR
jgi:TolB-like protein/Tfp pilus assembly protein PilF